MPCAPVHQFAGAVSGLAVSLVDDDERRSPLVNPVTAPIAGYYFGRAPDILEPALHPNHRQFFHSCAVFVAVLYGIKKAYEWQPQTDMQRFLRGMALVAGVVYAGHLALDACTRKSLPLVGKL